MASRFKAGAKRTAFREMVRSDRGVVKRPVRASRRIAVVAYARRPSGVFRRSTAVLDLALEGPIRRVDRLRAILGMQRVYRDVSLLKSGDQRVCEGVPMLIRPLPTCDNAQRRFELPSVPRTREARVSGLRRLVA